MEQIPRLGGLKALMGQTQQRTGGILINGTEEGPEM